MFDSARDTLLKEIIDILSENKDTKENQESAGAKENQESAGAAKKDKNSEIIALKVPGLNMADIELKRLGHMIYIKGESKDKYLDNIYRITNCFELNKGKGIDTIDAKLENGILYIFVTYKEKEQNAEQIIKIK